MMRYYSLLNRWITLKYNVIEYFNKSNSKKKHKFLRKKSAKTLKRIDKTPLTEDLNEIRLFTNLRNESLRLPHFLQYYKKMGVNRFFFIDNNSTDNSSEIILQYDNVHLFSTTDNFSNHHFWIEHLLEAYGKNHWCMVVDIDELFSYPNQEILKLPQLIEYFEEKKFTSISSLLLDMYDSKELSKVDYIQGQNPFEHLRFFDKDYYKSNFHFWDWKNMKPIITNAYTGGMRERVFGSTEHPLDVLIKTSLFKYEKDVYLVDGMHAISNTTPSDIEGIVFHTKFLQDFISEVQEEAVREQHYDNASRYKHYNRKIHNNLSLYCPEKSVKYESLEQLIDLGLMKTSEIFELFTSKYLIRYNK